MRTILATLVFLLYSQTYAQATTIDFRDYPVSFPPVTQTQAGFDVDVRAPVSTSVGVHLDQPDVVTISRNGLFNLSQIVVYGIETYFGIYDDNNQFGHYVDKTFQRIDFPNVHILGYRNGSLIADLAYAAGLGPKTINVGLEGVDKVSIMTKTAQANFFPGATCVIFTFNNDCEHFNLTSVEVQAVPLPASYALLGAGLFLLVGQRRFRSRRA